MAINTYSVKLSYLYDATTDPPTYREVAPIKDFPDLGQSVPGLETTTTTDPARKYISGIGETPAELRFTTNYTLETYESAMDLAGVERTWLVSFQRGEGELHSDGGYQFKGYLDAYVLSGGVNEVVNLALSIAPSTPLKYIAVLNPDPVISQITGSVVVAPGTYTTMEAYATWPLPNDFDPEAGATLYLFDKTQASADTEPSFPDSLTWNDTTHKYYPCIGQVPKAEWNDLTALSDWNVVSATYDPDQHKIVWSKAVSPSTAPANAYPFSTTAYLKYHTL